jgi:hypothetical protein
LLVASETGHIYSFATPKFEPFISSDQGRTLIQTCLDNAGPSSTPAASPDPNIPVIAAGTAEETDETQRNFDQFQHNHNYVSQFASFPNSISVTPNASAEFTQEEFVFPGLPEYWPASGNSPQTAYQHLPHQ